MREVVIASVARSPIGRAFKGSLLPIRPEDITAQVISAALAEVPQVDLADIDELVLGCGLPGGEQGMNLARVVAVLLGADGLPGTTVNRFCASSLQSTRMAFHAIATGEADVVVSAGVEMVSRLAPGNPDAPEFRSPAFPAASTATPWVDPRSLGSMPDVYIDMGSTAENVAGMFGIDRGRADEFAYRSQMRAAGADRRGFWATDITPVVLPDGTVVDRDDAPRPGTTLDGLAALAPVFREDGLVTAGNACGINDGAAAVVLMSADRAAALGIAPLARILGTSVSALSPEIMGLGPVEAVRRVLGRADLGVDDIDLFEINEAFAVQVLACADELGLSVDRLNVNGGAIALGHPYGMTGARITSTLIHGMQERDARFGVESMCVAGGMGMAMLIERIA